MDITEAIGCVLEVAKTLGVAETEVVAAESETLKAGVRLGSPEKLTRARGRRIAIRMFENKSSALCSTTDLTRKSLDNLARQCRDLARATAADPYSGLEPPDIPPVVALKLDLYDSTAEEFPVERALKIAGEAEAAALDSDPRITNSEGSEFGADSTHMHLATSHGFHSSYSTTSFSISVIPVASENGSMQRDSWYTVARRFEMLDDAAAVGRKAAARTVRRLSARKISTRKAPVVFEAPVAGSLLSHLAGAVSGSSIYRGLSFLRNRLDEQIAAPGISIIDDSRLPGRIGSRPFDAEGKTTRRNSVVENGLLRQFLLDGYSARRLGRQSTASAVRSLGDSPQAGPSNFYLENGHTEPGEILAGLSAALLVTSLSGLGVNPVTGDYSRGASGIWIERGEPTYAVEEITIASNLLSMFRGIEAVGNDLEFRSRIASPTLLVGRMTIAGEA